MTICWTVTRPIVAAVQHITHRTPPRRIFHTLGHAQHAARAHRWVAAKVIGWSVGIACVAGTSAPFLLPGRPSGAVLGPIGFVPGGSAGGTVDVPEPSALLVMAVALVGLAVVRWMTESRNPRMPSLRDR
jgi:hypothetical protein